MKMCSLFDGSGGFCLAAALNGIIPVECSEVEPFPIRVTSKRMPWVKHLGDVSKINGAEIEPVDIITFGSPCQDLSIAGKRAGLQEGDRSNLFFQAIRIVKEMRKATNGIYPRFAVWENVPGAFSSNKGEDFRMVLQEFCQVKEAVDVPRPEKWHNAGEIGGGGYSIAWRVFDAQFWGVPQRRKRIYLVADFNGECAGEILFEQDGVSRNFTQGCFEGQRVTPVAQKSIGKTKCLDTDLYNQAISGDIATTLTTCTGRGASQSGPTVMVLNDHGGERMDVTFDSTTTLRAKSNHPPIVFENNMSDARYNELKDACCTLKSRLGTGGNNQPLVLETPNPHSGIYQAGTSRTLDLNGGNPACNQGGIVVLQGSMIGRKEKNGPQGDGVGENVCFTLNTVDRHAVALCKKHATLSAADGPKGIYSQQLNNPSENFVLQKAYGIDRAAFNQGCNAKYSFTIAEEIQPTIVAKGPSAVGQPLYCLSKESHFTSPAKDIACTLAATDYKRAQVTCVPQKGVSYMGNGSNVAEPDYIVRRLTPTECAKLQGFPTWWCSDLETPHPTDEEIAEWRERFITHARIVGKSVKPKSDNQIRKWLQNPHSDSAEYKMWGNGIALPCASFIMAGMKKYDKEKNE